MSELKTACDWIEGCEIEKLKLDDFFSGCQDNDCVFATNHMSESEFNQFLDNLCNKLKESKIS